MVIHEIGIFRVEMPYDRLYPVAFDNIIGADAIIVRVRDKDGRTGWGEVTIVCPGYTDETVRSGLDFCRRVAQELIGRSIADCKRKLVACVTDSPHAATPLFCALEMLERNPLLQRATTVRVPLIGPLRMHDASDIPDEIEKLIALGHRTLKIKVGFDVEKDLKRVALIQNLVGTRARIRIDANQGYNAADGSRFAASLNPEITDWFEQPCNRHDWDSNATVAAASAVPIMLDEQIYSFSDVQRAAGIEGVGYIKHVLEKFASLELLKLALDHIRVCGLQPVLGNGAATDITSWMEACVAAAIVSLPSEMHSFLKVREPLLSEPLSFQDGDIVMDPSYYPTVNEDVLRAHTVWSEQIAMDRHVIGRNFA